MRRPWDRLPPLPPRRVAIVPAFTAADFFFMVAIASIVFVAIGGTALIVAGR